MKRLALATICALTMATQAFSQDYNDPMEGYTPTDISSSEAKSVWNSMRTDLKNKDCYRRAQLWTHDMYTKQRIYSRKIFIHYTDKFNRELDNLGREDGLGWFSRKRIEIDGVDNRVIRLIRSNITWDYHVAPLLSVDGEDVVMDRTLSLPYGEGNTYRLSTRMSTPEEWLDALANRGELFYKARRQELYNDYNEAKAKYNKFLERGRTSKIQKFAAKMREAMSQIKRLGMDKNKTIDIKCKKITSMVELDKGHDKEWCYYSIVPMYYYNEIDLRNLAYGRIPGLNYARAVGVEHHTAENFANGRDYVQTRFNPAEVEDAQGEIKADSEREELEREQRRARTRAERERNRN